MTDTLYQELGGEPALRQIVDRFVDRIFDDVMIGFFFRNASRDRIKEMEFQFAAEFLGADIKYGGKPLRDAHRPHPIMGGQFARRTQILKEVLEELGAPTTVCRAWLEHTEKLRPLITQDDDSDCDPLTALKNSQNDH